MADTKLSAFTNGGGWQGTDILGAARAGANIRGTATEMVTFVENNISIGTALEGTPGSTIEIDNSSGLGVTEQTGCTTIGAEAVAGTNGDANTINATAIGYQSTAGGRKSTAIGFNTSSSGINAVAIGDSAICSGAKSVAIGNDANVAGSATVNFSVGIGSTINIDNDDCIGIGQAVTIQFDDCIVLGASLTADFANQFKYGNKYLELGQFASGSLNSGASYEGHIVYETDSNDLQVYDGSDWVSYSRKYQTISETTGTTYTYVLADAGRHREFANASATTVTVPPNSSVAFPVGTQIDGHQGGAGQVTIAQGAGVTIRTSETLKIRQQYCGFTLKKIATDEWVLFGDLEETA